MQSLTYTEIIDVKIAEWGNNLKKLEEQVTTATPNIRAELNSKTNKLNLAISKAIVELRKLDEQETVNNTVETKNKILTIFNSIDKEFIGDVEKTPFML